jgi:hypothetical protein
MEGKWEVGAESEGDMRGQAGWLMTRLGWRRGKG